MIFKIPGREGARRRGEEAPPPPRAVAEPIFQQPPPQPMVEGNDIAIVEERTADDTHPVEGKTELEKEAEKSILDHIIDNL